MDDTAVLRDADELHRMRSHRDERLEMHVTQGVVLIWRTAGYGE